MMYKFRFSTLVMKPRHVVSNVTLPLRGLIHTLPHVERNSMTTKLFYGSYGTFARSACKPLCSDRPNNSAGRAMQLSSNVV